MIADLEKAKYIGYFYCSSIPFLSKIHFLVGQLLLPRTPVSTPTLKWQKLRAQTENSSV